MPIQKDPEGMEIFHLNKVATFVNKRALEIGCGDGRLTWKYASSAGSVTGIDPDVQALQAAIQTCPRNLRQAVSFVRADSINLPFPQEKFDLAIMSWSL